MKTYLETLLDQSRRHAGLSHMDKKTMNPGNDKGVSVVNFDFKSR